MPLLPIPNVSTEEELRSARRKTQLLNLLGRCDSRRRAVKAMLDHADGDTALEDILLLMDRLSADMRTLCAMLERGRSPDLSAPNEEPAGSSSPFASAIDGEFQALSRAVDGLRGKADDRKARRCLAQCLDGLYGRLREEVMRLVRGKLRTRREVCLRRLRGAVIGFVCVAAVAGWMTIQNRNRAEARSMAEVTVSDMQRLTKALNAFNGRNGHFPVSSRNGAGLDGLYSSYGESGREWIKGLVPEYIPELPRDPRKNEAGDTQYLYISNGGDYKLIAHNPNHLVMREVLRSHPEMCDPLRPDHAFGSWTPGAVGW